MTFSSSDDRQVMGIEEMTTWLERLHAGTTLFLEQEGGMSLPVLLAGLRFHA